MGRSERAWPGHQGRLLRFVLPAHVGIAALALLVVIAACSSEAETVAPSATPTSPPETAIVADTDVMFRTLDDRELPVLVPDESAPAQVELLECFWLGDGTWDFRGRVELPSDTDRAEFIVTLDWFTRSDVVILPLHTGVVTASASGEFTTRISAADTAAVAVNYAPTGTMSDNSCLLSVNSSSVPVERAVSFRGPTSAEIQGPRPSSNGRLSPSAADLDFLHPDVVGSLTGFRRYESDEPGYQPGSPQAFELFGPGVLSIDGIDYQVPAPTTYGGCRMIHVLRAPGSGRPSTPKCYVLAGLDDNGDVEWVAGLAGDEVAWNGDREWKHGFAAVASVKILQVSQILDDAVVVFDRSNTKVALPLADQVDFTCDQAEGSFQPWELPLGYVTEGRFDVETGELVEVTCSERAGG